MQTPDAPTLGEKSGLAERVETLQARLDKLRSTRSVLSKALYGSKSERQKMPGTGRKRGQQRGAAGHGRTQRPGLREKKETRDPPEDARVCPRCGKLYAANGERCTTLFEIDVEACENTIVRSRWRRSCECASSPRDVTALPVARLFDTTPYGISVWACMLYERFVCCRPLHRVAAWLADMGLAISPGTLADSIKRFVPLFKPLAKAILAHRNTASLRYADETTWRVQAYREKGRSSRAWLWISVSRDALYDHIEPSRSAEVAKLLVGSTEGTVVLVCDHLSTCKRLARALDGKVVLQWCWPHQRRSFIDRAVGHVRLRRWRQRWIERTAEIDRLNDARLEPCNPALPLERQMPTFDVAHARLKKALDALFAAAEADLAGLTDRARRAKPLHSLLKHREGLCVFVDKPFVSMDNNRGYSRSGITAVIPDHGLFPIPRRPRRYARHRAQDAGIITSCLLPLARSPAMLIILRISSRIRATRGRPDAGSFDWSASSAAGWGSRGSTFRAGRGATRTIS